MCTNDYRTNNQLIASHYLDPKKQSRYDILVLSLQQLNFFLHKQEIERVVKKKKKEKYTLKEGDADKRKGERKKKMNRNDIRFHYVRSYHIIKDNVIKHEYRFTHNYLI